MAHISALVPQAKQRDNVLALVNNRDSQMLFTVWLTVLQLIMGLHFRLFKRGRLFSHMQLQPELCDVLLALNSAWGPEANPVAQTLTGVAIILFAPYGA